MKKLILTALFGSIFFFAITTAKAQLNISVNIGSQPNWAPVYYEHINYVPVRHYVPVRSYYIPARHYKTGRSKHYHVPGYYKVKHKNHGHYKTFKYRGEKRDRGIERIIRPRG
ncbi:hypothetical protein [Pedobacter sp. JY14-1]|uniref:hypothetical protein n=1 Tax=Pedobacter sp. JY14-1 TaxID=3034151 RepID=UPI0023E26058|nr:hypothetical protein [Pedobacter sp. JY14-1]